MWDLNPERTLIQNVLRKGLREEVKYKMSKLKAKFVWNVRLNKHKNIKQAKFPQWMRLWSMHRWEWKVIYFPHLCIYPHKGIQLRMHFLFLLQTHEKKKLINLCTFTHFLRPLTTNDDNDDAKCFYLQLFF